MASNSVGQFDQLGPVIFVPRSTIALPQTGDLVGKVLALIGPQCRRVKSRFELR